MPEKHYKRYVHLGCGDIDRPYFINVDARNLPHVDHVTDDMTDLSFLADDSIELIYAAHIIEHVSWRYQPVLFNRFFQKLSPGGVLRISVPDFDRIIYRYSQRGNNLSEIIDFLYGAQDHPFNFHFCCFNTDVLTKLFQNAGFTTINAWDPKQVSCHDFEDFANHPVSLNLEGYKPHQG